MTAEQYDILISAASHKHSLTSARSLARAGLRVALGEAEAREATTGFLEAGGETRNRSGSS